MHKGFSLVELSIVLVILGLLTGGILAGQSLIRASEMRALTSQITRYQTAVYTFRDKYQGMPGDLTTAERFWGTDPDGCPTHALWQTTKTQTCNGNGSGTINTNPEKFRFWQQLAAAGLIEGSYSGVTGPDNAGSCNAQDHEPGYNVPAGKAGNTAFGVHSPNNGNYITPGLTTYWFEGDYTNSLVLGGTYTACEPINIAFTPEETWNVDMKLDDGKPGMGRIMVRSNGASGHPNCTDGNSTQAATAQYLLSYKAAACGIYVMRGL